MLFTVNSRHNCQPRKTACLPTSDLRATWLWGKVLRVNKHYPIVKTCGDMLSIMMQSYQCHSSHSHPSWWFFTLSLSPDVYLKLKVFEELTFKNLWRSHASFFMWTPRTPWRSKLPVILDEDQKSKWLTLVFSPSRVLFWSAFIQKSQSRSPSDICRSFSHFSRCRRSVRTQRQQRKKICGLRVTRSIWMLFLEETGAVSNFLHMLRSSWGVEGTLVRPARSSERLCRKR